MLTANHNPDVLSCLANLSNDEVFTPPAIANAMLDLLPPELFKSSTTTFLDPACKSGVFLREIAKRLIAGLADEIPDLQKRLNHIFTKQLFGIAITELTAHLSRRSLYCSKSANGKYSVAKMETAEGNIRFSPIKHTWANGRCVHCGAAQSEYDRADAFESHAYQFIHHATPPRHCERSEAIHPTALQELLNMKFDVIIGNPPYQMATGGAQSQATPIYHRFVQQAKKLTPNYVVMITPSRWFAGGMGLDGYREEMLSDRRISKIVDYSLSTDCFPGVDIAGGVSFFIWDRLYKGLCEYTFIDGNSSSTKLRQLNEYSVFVRNNNALSIIKKVVGFKEVSLSAQMSSLSPFGLGSSERGHHGKCNGDLMLMSSAGQSYISPKQIRTGLDYVKKWKVVIGKATSAGAATANKEGLRKVIATLEVLPPCSVCTFSYFIGGCFEREEEAFNCRKYISSKFVRFLLLQHLSSINISKDKFEFVPMQDFSKPWTDEELYAKYKLTEDEINFIESMIRPME